jgi:hypothetical protein
MPEFLICIILYRVTKTLRPLYFVHCAAQTTESKAEKRLTLRLRGPRS